MITAAVLSHKSDALFARVLVHELSLRGMKTVCGDFDFEPDAGVGLIVAVCRTESDARVAGSAASGLGIPCLTCGEESAGVDFARPMVIADFIGEAAALVERNVSSAAPVQTAAPVKDIEVDTKKRKVRYGGEDIALSSREFDLLLYLYERRGQTVTRSELRENVWGSAAETNNTDVYIRYLRSKLDERFDTHFIETVRGIGYRLRSN